MTTRARIACTFLPLTHPVTLLATLPFTRLFAVAATLPAALFSTIATTLPVALLVGCQAKNEVLEPFRPRAEEKDYGRPLPPGQLALRKLSPEEYPDFSRGFSRDPNLVRAIRFSLDYLAKPSSQRYYPYGEITHARATASLRHFLEVLERAGSPQEFDQIIRAEFDVYQSVGCDDRGTVYFTGYYTPIFDGRKRPDARFRYPLYGLPPDLVKDEEGRALGRRLRDGRIEPRYYTRREIEEQGLLRGREIAWLADPFEAYVVTVQGSARLRLADGSLWELGYAGNNGHEYTPIAAQMIEDGLLTRSELSLQWLLSFFRDRPDLVEQYGWRNDRYVFFKESKGGPFGSINVPVTSYRTIATDKEVFPRACLAYLDTNLPTIRDGVVQTSEYAAFALDQDTGGAIRAAGRCDVYMGVGPAAEAVAGRTGAEGALYYLFSKMGGDGIASLGDRRYLLDGTPTLEE